MASVRHRYPRKTVAATETRAENPALKAETRFLAREPHAYVALATTGQSVPKSALPSIVLSNRNADGNELKFELIIFAFACDRGPPTRRGEREAR